MRRAFRISFRISAQTRRMLDAHMRRTGVKKGHIVEQALLHRLQPLLALPAEWVVHPRVVLSRKTGEALLRRARQARPTAALRKLMRGED